MTTPSAELKRELAKIANDYLNILAVGPWIDIRGGVLPTHKEVHFIYPLEKVAGNAVDGRSLVAMQNALSVALDRHVGTMWIGVHKDTFHIWAAYKDIPRDAKEN